MSIRTLFGIVRELAKAVDAQNPDIPKSVRDSDTFKNVAKIKEALEAFERVEQAEESARHDRKALAARIVARRRTERIFPMDMPFTSMELTAMVAHLRPGMPVSVVDDIRMQSVDILDAELLTGERAWRKAYMARQPCILTVSKDRMIERVVFPHFDVEGLGKLDPGSVIAAKPNARRDTEREVQGENQPVVTYPAGKGDTLVVVHFFSGKPFSTAYESPVAYKREVAKVARRNAKIRDQRSVPPPEPKPVDLSDIASAHDDLRRVMTARRDQTGDPFHHAFAEWLIGQSTPDDRHILLNANWDHGFDIPLWIIRQPDTYIETAIKAYWMGNARTWIADPLNTQSLESVFAHDLDRRLRTRFHATPKGPQAIAYDPPKEVKEDADLQASVPPVLLKARKGRTETQISCAMPAEWWEYLC